MCKKYIASILIPSLLIHLYGCYSFTPISKDELAGLNDSEDIIVSTKDSIIYFFEESNYHISNDSLYGKGYVKFNEDSDFNVPIDSTIAMINITSIEEDELNPVTTSLLIMGSVLLALFVVAVILVSQSFD